MNRAIIFGLFMLLAACGPSAEELNQQARELLASGQGRQAIRLLDQSIEKDPVNPQSHLLRGVAWYKEGEFARAESSFVTGLLSDSTDYRFYYNLGNVKRQQNLPAEAIEFYSRSIGLFPDNYEAWLNRGLAFNTLQQFNNALSDLYTAEEKAAEADQNIFFYRGKINFRLENLKEAAYDFEMLIGINPDHAEAHHSLALTRLILQNGPDTRTCELLERAFDLGFEPAADLVKEFCTEK